MNLSRILRWEDKIMKKLLVLTLLGLFILSGCSSSEDKETIIVGTTGQSYPNSYEKDGELVGYDIEVFEKAAKKEGYKVKWVKADFSGIMGQLDSKRVDSVANAVAVTDERKEKYQFSNPYSYIGSQIVTSTKNKDINEYTDLKGKTIAGVMGSNHTESLERFNKENNYDIKIKTYENRESAMLDLDNRRIDGYINSSSVLSAEKNKKGKNIKFVGEPINIESTSFPFKKDNADKKKDIDKGIKELKSNGELKKLSEKYFGEDTTKK